MQMINLDDKQLTQAVKKGRLHLAFYASFLTVLSGFHLIAGAQTSVEKPVQAQPALTSGPRAPDTKSLNNATVSSKPLWQELTPTQKVSLAPLATHWNTLEEAQKRKWIAIASNYPALGEAEKIKMHNRMTEWVSLSNQQRAQARLNFAQSKQLTPTEKTASWEAYQALSPEEKQKLAALAPPKLTGAAIATKPVPPQKLAAIPPKRPMPLQAPKAVAETPAVHRYTLLPQSKASAAQASTPNK
jgi:hypothetical protein